MAGSEKAPHSIYIIYYMFNIRLSPRTLRLKAVTTEGSVASGPAHKQKLKILRQIGPLNNTYLTAAGSKTNKYFNQYGTYRLHIVIEIIKVPGGHLKISTV